MIDMTKAVRKAESHFRDLVGDAAADSAAVEEVELKEEAGQRFWEVTLTALVALVSPTAAALSRGKFDWSAKTTRVIRIDAETGEALSMKMRDSSCRE